jgi:hypothetical protein
MVTKLFTQNLNKFNIHLDDDAAEYISGMLESMSMDEADEIRASTESFLIDANIDEDTRSAFYSNLFENNVSTPKGIKDQKMLPKPLQGTEKAKEVCRGALNIQFE